MRLQDALPSRLRYPTFRHTSGASGHIRRLPPHFGRPLAEVFPTEASEVSAATHATEAGEDNSVSMGRRDES